MLKHIWGHQIPRVLREPALFDKTGLPKYWATVWSMFHTADLAPSSKRNVLSHVEALYQFSETLHGPGMLDDALFSVDIEKLGQLLKAYFVSIRNLPNINEAAQLKWQTAFRFVSDIIRRLSKSDLPIAQLQQFQGRLIGLTLARLSAPVTYSSNKFRLFGVGPYERKNRIHEPAGGVANSWSGMIGSSMAESDSFG